jgi:hypothetical protein
MLGGLDWTGFQALLRRIAEQQREMSHGQYCAAYGGVRLPSKQCRRTGVLQRSHVFAALKTLGHECLSSKLRITASDGRSGARHAEAPSIGVVRLRGEDLRLNA